MFKETIQGQWQAIPQQWWQSMAGEVPAADTDDGNAVAEEGQGPSGYSEFASQILKDVPEEHRAIFEPHLQKWDAGTQRRFQDLNNKYKQYDSLDWDEETTTQMAEIYRVLQEEPETLYELLKAEFEETVEKAQEGAVVGSGSQELPGVPPEIMAQLTQQQSVLEALAQYVLNEQSTKTQAAEDSDLDSYMKLLKKEYGDFDEDYVLTKIANGQDGEAAVKQYMSAVQEYINKAAASTEGLPPAMLSSAGGGAVAQQEPQKLGSYSSKDIRNLITNVVTQANEAGQ